MLIIPLFGTLGAIGLGAWMLGRPTTRLEIGDALPRVSGKSLLGKRVQLADEASTGWVLVYFYPKADTPGCTAQACSLRDAHVELVKLGVKVYGVSADSLSDLKNFSSKYQLPFQLIQDEGGEITKGFGVRRYLGKFAKRQAFLFRDGRLFWVDREGATSDQAEQVLTIIREKE